MKTLTFSLARYNKQTKAIGEDKFLDIFADTLLGRASYIVLKVKEPLTSFSLSSLLLSPASAMSGFGKLLFSMFSCKSRE